ncbi:FitA-like ribbon-helix-helix domain-containing protein [Thermomonas flagellata]|uniref:FitA-like ribbon-helix-helix domain-containing protein n=1 Tax=Thermomonas flagellata TaxID=2888524 RepID=UPI001F038479|nr:Arc family DNA-binding protein [Thermomonas flagellata]
MRSVTIRNLPEEVHRAIRARAMRHGRSVEAELREILEAAVRPRRRVELGSRLAAAGRKAGVSEAEVTALRSMRGNSPARAARLE